MKDEYENEKLKLIIRLDIIPDDPRKHDNLGIMVAFFVASKDERYILGDKTKLTPDQFCTWDDLKNYLINQKKAKVILPLYLLNIGKPFLSNFRIEMRTEPFYEDISKWNSGQAGFIYTTNKRIKKFYGDKKPSEKEIEEVLKSEVEAYSNYLEGNTYAIFLYKKEPERFITYSTIYGNPDKDKVLDYLNSAKVEKDLKPYLEDLKKKIEG